MPTARIKRVPVVKNLIVWTKICIQIIIIQNDKELSGRCEQRILATRSSHSSILSESGRGSGDPTIK